ncbi:MAG: hypothetical protein IJP88_04330 [Synergistaceae bacterium]|nr:hypothetical protein [Synergistaceae bacterium]
MAYVSWFEEGLKKVYLRNGRHEAYLDTARGMLQLGIAVDDIAKVTHLSAAEIEALTATN